MNSSMGEKKENAWICWVQQKFVLLMILQHKYFLFKNKIYWLIPKHRQVLAEYMQREWLPQKNLIISKSVMMGLLTMRQA